MQTAQRWSTGVEVKAESCELRGCSIRWRPIPVVSHTLRGERFKSNPAFCDHLAVIIFGVHELRAPCIDLRALTLSEPRAYLLHGLAKSHQHRSGHLPRKSLHQGDTHHGLRGARQPSGRAIYSGNHSALPNFARERRGRSHLLRG